MQFQKKELKIIINCKNKKYKKIKIIQQMNK